MALTFYTGDFFLITYTAVSILLSILLTINMPQGLWKMTSLRAFMQYVSSTENLFLLPQLCHAIALQQREHYVLLKCAGPVAKRQYMRYLYPQWGGVTSASASSVQQTSVTENRRQIVGADFLSTHRLQHEGFGGGKTTSPDALMQGYWRANCSPDRDQGRWATAAIKITTLQGEGEVGCCKDRLREEAKCRRGWDVVACVHPFSVT